MLGVSRDSIRRYVESGALEAITTPGGQRRIDSASVEHVIQGRRKISPTVTIIEAE
jgi:excisionase family DNA binding protein